MVDSPEEKVEETKPAEEQEVVEESVEETEAPAEEAA